MDTRHLWAGRSFPIPHIRYIEILRLLDPNRVTVRFKLLSMSAHFACEEMRLLAIHTHPEDSVELAAALDEYLAYVLAVTEPFDFFQG